MAVPKRKTSVSKRNMRRSHDSLKKINIILDKDSGEPRLPHKIDLSTGMYKGREILKKRTKEKWLSLKNIIKRLQRNTDIN